MPPLHFARVDTVDGPMLVARSAAGIVAIAPAERLEPLLAHLGHRFPQDEPLPVDAAPDAAGSWLREWLGGQRTDLPPVDLTGLSAHQMAVYTAVRGIPWGATATYGEIAAMVGAPRAARAVGNAMARCPLFPAVPCHRVVRAADGFSGWSADPRRKRRLLERER